MSWFPVDDAFHSHPKMRRAGLEATGLWVVSGSYCMAYLTDGFVPEWFVKEKPRGLVLAKRLIAAELWGAAVNDQGEKGWQFHEWKPECTKEHVEAARKIARDRKRKSRAAQADAPDDVTRDVTRDGRGTSRGCLVPTQPNPTQPINPLETLGGGVALGNAQGSPRPKCSKHETNSDEPCPACLRRRKWDDEHAGDQTADELDAKRQAREIRDACGICHGTNWIPDTEPARKCNHTEESSNAI